MKGLIDFRRLGDDETDLVLAILVFEDLIVAFMLGFSAAGGGGPSDTLVLVAKALGFITIGLAASRWLARPLDRALDRLPLEFFLLAVFGFLIGSAALADELGLSEAIGALMAGIVLSETSVRDQIEERFFSFRDIFAALFFFVFGLSIDLSAIGDVGLARRASGRTDARRQARRRLDRRPGRWVHEPPEPQRRASRSSPTVSSRSSWRSSLRRTHASSSDQQAEIVAFAGLYVLVTATIGIVLMKESKRLGRALFPTPRLTEEA